MKKNFEPLFIFAMFSFLSFAQAARQNPPSTLSFHFVGNGAPSYGTSVLGRSGLETIAAGGQADRYLVLTSVDNHRCVISKAAAAKQGVSIEFLNEMAARYQVEVTCVYVYPLSPGQIAANDFAFRASMR